MHGLEPGAAQEGQVLAERDGEQLEQLDAPGEVYQLEEGGVHAVQQVFVLRIRLEVPDPSRRVLVPHVQQQNPQLQALRGVRQLLNPVRVEFLEPLRESLNQNSYEGERGINIEKNLDHYFYFCFPPPDRGK